MREAFDSHLRAVRRRYNTNLLLRITGCALSAAGLVAAAAVLAERTVSLKLVNRWTAGGLFITAVVAAIILWLAKRYDAMAAALLIDERLAAKERFSTALALCDSDDPFAAAAVNEAHQAARGTDIHGRFPIRPTRSWLLAAAGWTAATALLLFMPDLDLLGYTRKAADKQANIEQLARVQGRIDEAAARVKIAVNELNDADLAKDLADLTIPPAGANSDQLRRQAILKLTDLADQLKKRQSDPQMQAAATMRQMLKNLRGGPQGAIGLLNQALAAGKFSRAAQIARELQRKLDAGTMDERQRKQLSKQLEALAAKLAKLAERDEQLADELDSAGLDKKLAKLSIKDLADALRKASLSREQIDKLLKKAAACKAAKAGCRGLSKALAACAGDGSASADALADLASQLDSFDEQAEKMGLCDAALAEIEAAIRQCGSVACNSQGQGPWRAGVGQGRSRGTGGPGQGMGPRASDNAGRVNLKATRVKNTSTDGPIIASWYFKGGQVKGHANRKMATVAQAAKDRAAEAINDNRIPRKYEQSVKQYFNELDRPDSGD